ncbi:MAG TPA: LptF/LptG family permease, partial [Immundisolibacter sp.]|nr:LptF/LptG family permease [Immundisolibacter sp.]
MILRRYLLRELASPFAVVCGSLLLVFTGYSSARFLGEAASGALPGSLAAVLIGLKLFISLDAIVPMALMLSVALGLGRLQRDQETTALAACGIGERWLFQAVLWLALPVAAVVAVASLVVRPQLYQNVYRLEA